LFLRLFRIMKDAPKTLLLILEGCDSALLEPSLAKGILPTFKKLGEGARAELVSLPPCRAATLFANVVTGRRLCRLGNAPSENEVGKSTDLLAGALWEKAAGAGMRSIVVGDTSYLHPREIDGVFVGGGWLAGRGGMHPAALSAELEALRVTKENLDPGVVRLLCPKLGAEIAARDPAAGRLAESLGLLYSACNVATTLLETEPWQLAIVQISFIERIVALFGNIGRGAPKSFEMRYEGIAENSLRLLDLLLGQILRAAGEKTAILAISTRGRAMLHPGAFASFPLLDPGSGLFLAAGPKLRKGARLGSVALTDVAPTVLAMLGLSPGDADGAVVDELFTAGRNPGRREAPAHPQAPSNVPEGVEPFDLAVDLFEGGRPELALPLFGRFAQENPESALGAFWLACCLAATGNGKEAWRRAAVIRDMDDGTACAGRWSLALLAARCGWHGRVLELLGESLGKNAPPILGVCAARALMAFGRWHDACQLLREELERRPSKALWLAMSDCYRNLGMPADAEAAVRYVMEDNPRLAVAHLALAQALKIKGRVDEARQSVLTARNLAPMQPIVRRAVEALDPPTTGAMGNAASRRSPETLSDPVEAVEEPPHFRPPKDNEMRRMRGILRFGTACRDGWNPRVWEAVSPARFVGAASWKMASTDTAHLVIRFLPRLAAGATPDDLRELFAEMASAGARQVMVLEAEGRLADGLFDSMGCRAEHWSDEDWSGDPALLRERLARHNESLSEAKAAGWRVRSFEADDWPILEKWAVGGKFMSPGQFGALHKTLDFELSAAAISPRGIGGILAASRQGLGATLEFICANPELPESAPVAATMLLRDFTKSRQEPDSFDEFHLNTNLHRSRAMHILAFRIGMRLIGARRHHRVELANDRPVHKKGGVTPA
jgi:tetratricopeptide (TPR) repeat protein